MGFSSFGRAKLDKHLTIVTLHAMFKTSALLRTVDDKISVFRACPHVLFGQSFCHNADDSNVRLRMVASYLLRLHVATRPHGFVFDLAVHIAASSGFWRHDFCCGCSCSDFGTVTSIPLPLLSQRRRWHRSDNRLYRTPVFFMYPASRV